MSRLTVAQCLAGASKGQKEAPCSGGVLLWTACPRGSALGEGSPEQGTWYFQFPNLAL